MAVWHRKTAVTRKIEDEAAERRACMQTAAEQAVQATLSQRNRLELAMVEQLVHGIQARPWHG
ncbi:hypothetical protein GCM10011408_02940 [Dyella caseinilytica]|nr:hypothetical protein GCM10011408_02940 [Dyella caseinilytica]